jgi:hypothetical protein
VCTWCPRIKNAQALNTINKNPKTTVTLPITSSLLKSV